MKLNTYITTTDLYKPLSDQRRIVQDMCLGSLQTPGVSQFFNLKEIITPEWCNPKQIDSYMNVPVQSVETRDLTNYNPSDVWASRRTCPVINNSRERGGQSADSEHLSLFENMKVETPCLLLDGDILLYYTNHIERLYRLLTGRFSHYKPPVGHSICASHAVFISCAEDQSKDLISMRSYLNPCPTVQFIRDTFFRTSTHLSRGMRRGMLTYQFVNTEQK
jgi:hypothetical protein